MKKIFYGWWIVLATSLIHFWGAGVFYYSFTAFFNPIVSEFGWTYAATSFAASLRSMEGGIASPLIGFAADRYGVRRLLFIGSILSGLGFILFSQINSLCSFYLVFLFLSAGSSLLFPVPGWTVVAIWFSRKRGTAIGILSAAVGAGGILIYLVTWFIGMYGWRSTLVIIGIGMWMIGIPSALIVRNNPESHGLLPDGDRPPESSSKTPKRYFEKQSRYPEEFSLSQALKTGTFWVIAMIAAISGAVLNAVVVHVMPYFISIQFSRETSSLIATLLVLVSVAGRLGSGWLGNRMDNRYLMALGLLLQVIGLIFLARAQTLWHAVLFILFFGPGYGGVITLRLTLLAEYYGRKASGAIQGATLTIVVIGAMVSPVLTGMSYDLLGSYCLAWYIMAAFVFASISLALRIRPPHKANDGTALSVD